MSMESSQSLRSHPPPPPLLHPSWQPDRPLPWPQKVTTKWTKSVPFSLNDFKHVMRKSEEFNMAGTSHLPKTAQNDTTEMLQLKMRYMLKHVLLGSCWWKEMWTTIALHASCICCLHRFSTAPAHTSHRTALNTPPRANILGCLDKSLKWSVSTAYHIEIHYPILCTKYIYTLYNIYIYYINILEIYLPDLHVWAQHMWFVRGLPIWASMSPMGSREEVTNEKTTFQRKFKVWYHCCTALGRFFGYVLGFIHFFATRARESDSAKNKQCSSTFWKCLTPNVRMNHKSTQKKGRQ